MKINLDRLDSITQAKYKDFEEKVERFLSEYEESDSDRYNLVKDRLANTNGNWDTQIELISNNTSKMVNISQLLVYEYCLASERITGGKVSFEEMLDKLFDGIQKFRIGNPVQSIDNECLYGKSLDDETAIPVTSKLYRLVMNAGAQHLDYLKKGKPTTAVFIYEKGIMRDIAKNEFGNSVDLKTDGIDFSNLSSGQSLLTNLRQTVFHEWNHNAEREAINLEENDIAFEYEGKDGKKYKNYEKINSYVTAENMTSFNEPQYIISSELDSNGNRKRYFVAQDGSIRPLTEVRFNLEKRKLEREYCFSKGLTTEEILPNGETKIHNIITEGFVEETARAMIKAIDPYVTDIDIGRYPEQVEIAKRVIASRDIYFDKEGETYADFLMHSTRLKKDLEDRSVTLEDGSKIDGLHYISDYAEKVQKGETEKAKFYKNMPKVAEKLNLSSEQIDKISKSNLWAKRELSDMEQMYLKNLLVSEQPSSKKYIDAVILEYVNILEGEAEFFDKISEKLGYADRSISKKKCVNDLAKEAIEALPNLTILKDIEQEERKTNTENLIQEVPESK